MEFTRGPRALLAMPQGLQHDMFSPAQLERLQQLADVDVTSTVPSFAEATDEQLAPVEVLVTGWGSPQVDGEALSRLPALRAIVHSAGTVRFVTSPAVWQRDDLVVTSATEVNAIPVAQYTLAQVLLAGKRSLLREAEHRRVRTGAGAPVDPASGNYGGVVGLIGASRIGTLVAQYLRPFDLQVLISDPFVDAEAIAVLGATKVELPELFTRSDVVSLHAPDLPSTRHLVNANLLALMRDGTTFINTARPALVDLDALRPHLLSGRLAAVLDVHDDLAPDDPVWDAPAVSITPHIAGSLGNELHRMGESVLEELRRLGAGEPPLYPVARERLSVSA